MTIVSIFEFDETSLEKVKYKKFLASDLEWLDMIMKCRTNPSFEHGYDVVEGKIADDSVDETILFVIDGIIKKENALEKLKLEKINSQVAFCNKESLELLKFVGRFEVK